MRKVQKVNSAYIAAMPKMGKYYSTAMRVEIGPWTISIIRHAASYGGRKGRFEYAIVETETGNWIGRELLAYFAGEPVMLDDVVGWQRPSQIMKVIKRMEEWYAIPSLKTNRRPGRARIELP